MSKMSVFKEEIDMLWTKGLIHFDMHFSCIVLFINDERKIEKSKQVV